MKTIIAVAFGAVFAFASSAPATDIASLAWDQSNIQTLRSFDKAVVVEFLNKMRRDGGFLNSCCRTI